MNQSNEKKNLENITFIPTTTENDAIFNYIGSRNPSLKILTPCFGGVCHVGYITSLMNTVELFKKINFPIEVLFCKNDSLVSRARNNLIALAMSDMTTTHMMFIDNDISWNPIDIIRLILSDKPLIGGVYPLKNYLWKNLMPSTTTPHNTDVINTWIKTKNSSNLNFVTDEKLIKSKMLNYNVNYLTGVLSISDNVAEVRHIATGFMMIKRDVIDKMFFQYPETKYTDDIGFLTGSQNDYAYALFDCGVRDGHYFSEDWLFCDRWTKTMGKVYINIAIDLVHTGVEDYTGSFMNSIMI